MKELASWVPQIFYDLIGRVAPGAFLLLIGAGLLVEPRVSRQILRSAAHSSTTLLILLGLLVSYVLATILGAVFGAIKDSEWSATRADSIKAEVPVDSDGGKLTQGQISYMYDAVQLYNPPAGARLAKLRAEDHMCRVLLAGAIALAPIYGFAKWHALVSIRSLVVFVGLAGMAFGSYLFSVHLAIRSRRLLVNCWHLLRKSPEAKAELGIDG